MVSNILAAGSIDAFHVYFPDPWWKKRHHKRRLFTDEFCAGLRSSMSAEARGFLMTDVESQFADIDQRLHAAGLERRHWARGDDATEAIRLDPEHAVFYFGRAITYHDLGKQELAERDFVKAKELGYEP